MLLKMEDTIKGDPDVIDELIVIIPGSRDCDVRCRIDDLPSPL